MTAVDATPPAGLRAAGTGRLLLGAAGVVTMAAGVVLALGLGTRALKLAAWLVGVAVLHDAVLAPAVLLLAAIGRRLLPRSAWGPAVLWLVAAGVLTALAAVALLRADEGASVPGLLDRDYGAGLLVSLAAVTALAVAAWAARRGRRTVSRVRLRAASGSPAGRSVTRTSGRSPRGKRR